MSSNRALRTLAGITLFFTIFLCSSCQTIMSFKKMSESGVMLPYIKNTPNECYYLDEFMPIPNSLVVGKSGSLTLRYYTYNDATYKKWDNHQIILSFYSRDDRCWSLFEEYYLAQ